MLTRHHTKWLVKKKAVMRKGANMNPMAKMAPVAKRKLMPATTTRLINRIWGEFYSNHSPEESKEEAIGEVKEEEAQEEEEDDPEELEEEKEEKISVEKTNNIYRLNRQRKLHNPSEDIEWEGEAIRKANSSEYLYKRANVHGDIIVVGGCVLVETAEPEELHPIYLIEYIEKSGGRKMAHGRLMLRGSQTVLGNAANEREVFLTNNCLDFELEDVKQSVVVEIRQMPWGYQHRTAIADKIDRAKAEERKSKGLPLEYYCKSLYHPDKGAFFSIPNDSVGIGNGICCSCKSEEADKDKENLKVNSSKTGFVYQGVEYNIDDFYVAPCCFVKGEKEN